jgi:diacylglycerol kinase family enzyme
LPKKFIAFINAFAGAARAKAKDDLRGLLFEVFQQHRIEADIRFPNPEELPHLLKEARESEVDGIIVGGGDGTIRTAAAALAGSRIPLGVLPLGTLNHFAKDLKLPVKLEDAAAVIGGGNAIRVDLGEVNGEIFINNSSIGIYPFMVLDRERIQEQEGKRKWHAAFHAAVRAMKKFPLRKLRVRVENETALHRSPVVFFGNNDYGHDPGRVGKRERLDRGELSVHIARVETRQGFLLLVLRGMLGKLRTSRDLKTLKGRFAEITSNTSRLPVALDGEVKMFTPPLRYVIKKQVLKVFVRKEQA